MKTSRIAQFKATSAPLVLGLALVSTPALAQVATPIEAAEDLTENVEADDIVVTGSLISNPNLDRSSPVNATTADEIELLQTNVAEEILREIPGVVPSIGSAVNNGNGGASFVNLRGLGSNRNVVLLDGTRIVPAELNGRTDLNNIPLALIERVDVLTGGSSTTYGADAVSGVVNFITRSDFSGIEINSAYTITEEGDGGTFRLDLTTGANFDDGRGNVVLGVGYQESDAVYQGARDISIFGITSANGQPGGSGTTVPSRFSLIGLGNRSISPDGQTLVAPYGPFNFNPFNVFQTPFERFNIYGAGRYEISDALEIYSRGLFSKNTVSTIIAPSGAFAVAVNIPLSNPFLPAGIRNQFCAEDVNPSTTVVTRRFSQAECDAAATAPFGSAAYREIGTGGFVPFDVNGDGVIGTNSAGVVNEGFNPNPTTNLSRRAVEAGPRISEYTTQVFDYKIGARGGITDTISWDVFGSYGESENLQEIQNYTLNSRFRQALRATSTTACIDPTNGCVPVNVFTPTVGGISAEAADFLTETSTVRTTSTLAQARATINGDLGFTSPFAGDAIAFAIGGEYRKYTASQASDTLAATGDLGGAGGAAPAIDGGFDVYEAIGEVVIPIVQDRPFFNDLTLEAGVRYSSYSIDAPGNPTFNTTTYKVGGSWSPFDSFKIRGNYARAVRAPNIAELFSPQNTLLTNLSDDPCATINEQGNRIRANPTGELRAICLAQGATAGTIDSIQQPTAGQINTTGGGNPNVGPETSDSWTLGVVFEPEFLPGVALTVDYYNIEITGAITSPTPGDAISACFGDNPLTPPAGASATEACTIIQRNPNSGSLSGDPSVTPGIFQGLSNLGRLETSGIDVSLNYRTDLGFADLSLSAVGNWTEKSVFQATPTSDALDCTGLYGTDCTSIQPEFQWSVRSTLSFENIDVSLLWRHIDNVRFDPGLTPIFSGTLPNVPNLGSFAGTEEDFNTIGAYDYFDLTTRFNISDNLSLTLSAQNIFDKKPPLVGSEAGSTSFNSGNTFPSTYDALGRRYTAAVKLRF